MASAWYIVDNGQEHGPFTVARMRDLVDQGKVTGASVLRREGRTETVRASAVKGLLSGTAPVVRKSKAGRRRQRHEQGTAKVTGKSSADAASAIDYGEGASVDESADLELEEEPAKGAYVFDAFAKDEDYLEQVRAQQMDQGFFVNISKLYSFPFSINAVAFMVAYIILGILLSTLGIFFIKLWWGFEGFFLFLTVWFILYGLAYMVRILLRSAEGDRKAPSWPELGGLLEYILGPAVLLIGSMTLLKIVYVLHAWGDLDLIPISQGIITSFQGVDMFLFHGLDLLFRLPSDGAGILMYVVIALIMPMVLLSVITKGGYLGLHPVPMFERLSKSFPAYAVLVLLVAALQVIMMLVWQKNCDIYGIDQTICYGYLINEFLPSLSFVDLLGFWSLLVIPSSCCLFLQYAAMGIFYRSESEKWD